MKTIKVSIRYNIALVNPAGTHSCDHEYVETEDFCPKCYTQLWSEAGAGDYYVGPKFYCPSCCWTGYVIFSYIADPAGHDADDQTIRAIRNEISKP